MSASFHFTSPRKEIKPESPERDDTYISMALPLFIDHLASSPDSQLLDVGPASGNNINFFAVHARRLYQSDLFVPLSRRRLLNKTFAEIWDNIDYPEASFDAVQLWNLGDYIDNRALQDLVGKCHYLLKPGGMLMLVAQSDQASSQKVRNLIIHDDFHISWRDLSRLNLSCTYRHNQDIISNLKPLKLVKSFIYRNGLREFLFRKELAHSDHFA